MQGLECSGGSIALTLDTADPSCSALFDQLSHGVLITAGVQWGCDNSHPEAPKGHPGPIYRRVAGPAEMVGERNGVSQLVSSLASQHLKLICSVSRILNPYRSKCQQKMRISRIFSNNSMSICDMTFHEWKIATPIRTTGPRKIAREHKWKRRRQSGN